MSFRHRTAVLSIILSVFMLRASAQQQAPCKGAVVAATVTAKDGRPIPNLDAKGLRARMGRKSVEVLAATLDNGPRRVLLAVETSKDMNSNAWRLAVAMTTTMVANARTQDSFALVTYGGAEETVPFAATNDAVRDKLAVLAANRPSTQGKDGDTSPYDAIYGALPMFGEPRFGDAIFLFTATPDDKGRIGTKKVEQALLARNVRLLALSLTQRAISGEGGVRGEEKSTPLSTNELRQDALDTGGLFVLENTEPESAHYVLDSRLKDMLMRGMQLYAMTVKVYRVEVNAPATGKLESWELETSDELRRQYQPIILHPQKIATCGTPIP